MCKLHGLCDSMLIYIILTLLWGTQSHSIRMWVNHSFPQTHKHTHLPSCTHLYRTVFTEYSSKIKPQHLAMFSYLFFSPLHLPFYITTTRKGLFTFPIFCSHKSISQVPHKVLRFTQRKPSHPVDADYRTFPWVRSLLVLLGSLPLSKDMRRSIGDSKGVNVHLSMSALRWTHKHLPGRTLPSAYPMSASHPSATPCRGTR